MQDPLMTKDTFLQIADKLPSTEILKLRQVCKKWRNWIDKAPWTWEPQEVIKDAKRWDIVLGFPKVGKKYSHLSQLGVNIRPSACTFVCVREEDQALEVKDLSENGTATLRDELSKHKEKVSVLRKLDKLRFAVGYETGKVVIWDSKTLSELQCFTPHKNAISQVAYICKTHKTLSRDGFIQSEQKDILISADESGEIKCWDILNGGGIKERWSKTFDLPVKEIRCTPDNNIKIVRYQSNGKIFYVSTLSLVNGKELDNTNKTDKRYGVGDISLKCVSFFRNNNFTALFTKNTPDNQLVFLDTYLWSAENKEYKRHRIEKFELEAPSKKWWSYQTLSLDDSVMWTSNVESSEGAAQIAYPKRLPNTLGSINKNEENEAGEQLKK